MVQHRTASATGQDSADHLHLKEKGHSFDDENVLGREDRWFEKRVQEAIYVKLEAGTPLLTEEVASDIKRLPHPMQLQTLRQETEPQFTPGSCETSESHDDQGKWLPS